MRCFLLLLLPLILLSTSAAAAGEPVQGAAMAPRAFAGFYSLFHVPAPAPPAAAAVASPPRAALPVPAPPTMAGTQGPGSLCRAAISAAERAHGIPAGLLFAIGLVESGRTDAATGERNPWPWAVNAEGRGALLDTREAALTFVRQAEATGVRSIDIGCMQVNRIHHPNAFASLEQGFDPAANADYAARFLRQLKEGPAGGDWIKAAGFYHSQTPERAEPYRTKVQATMAALPAQSRQPPPIPPAAGGGGQMLANGASQAMVMAAAPGMTGRGLDAYRARPVPLAMVAAGIVTSPSVTSPVRRAGSVGP